MGTGLKGGRAATDTGRMASWDPSAGRGDTGDVIVSWLVRLVVVLATVGVLIFDALSVGSSRLSIEDHAATAARAAADSWAATHNKQTAFTSAWESATQADAGNQADPKSFLIDPDGQAHVSLSREAPTLVVHLVGPLRHWALVRSSAVSKPSPA